MLPQRPIYRRTPFVLDGVFEAAFDAAFEALKALAARESRFDFAYLGQQVLHAVDHRNARRPRTTRGGFSKRQARSNRANAHWPTIRRSRHQVPRRVPAASRRDREAGHRERDRGMRRVLAGTARPGLQPGFGPRLQATISGHDEIGRHGVQQIAQRFGLFHTCAVTQMNAHGAARDAVHRPRERQLDGKSQAVGRIGHDGFDNARIETGGFGHGGRTLDDDGCSHRS